jgi:hypothetical protein
MTGKLLTAIAALLLANVTIAKAQYGEQWPPYPSGATECVQDMGYGPYKPGCD